MITYANQSVIHINRIPKSTGSLYTYLDLASIQAAMSDLKKVGAVKLWIYFTRNKNEFSLALSQKACEEFGISISEYRSGKDELKEKGYLLETEGSNIMQFYEWPEMQNPEIQKARQERNIKHFDDLFDGLSNMYYEYDLSNRNATTTPFEY